MTPPATRRDEGLVEVLHGRRVADPYRWLEEAGSDEVREWVAAQNAATRAVLDAVAERPAIHARLAELWDHPRRGPQWRRGARWFQLRNSGLEDQDVLWVADDPDGEGRVLLDPNTLSPDGTVSIAALAVSRDGAHLAYALAEAGSDWQTWHVLRVEDGTEIDEALPWAKFSSAAWLPDGSGFFYSRYAPPPPGEEHRAANRDQRLAFHRLGTAAEDDRDVYARPDHPEWGFSPMVTHDGRWLVVTVWEGTDRRSRVYLAPLDGDPGRPEIRPLLDDFDARWDVVETVGDFLYLSTDRDAPRGRLVAVDLTRPEDPAGWQEVIAEGEGTLEQVVLCGMRLLALSLVDARHALRRHALDGTEEGLVELPGLGTVMDVSGRPDDALVHLVYTDFATPSTVCRHDLATGETSVAHRGLALEPDAIVTEQLFVDSTDGARVPMFVVHRADHPAPGPDTPAPTLLYAYGGFGIPLTPAFRLAWHVWVERGGVLAVGCLRGGGEYGEAWHAAGRGAEKQHTFDDAIACGEALVHGGWTSPERLGITGGSNGGLTVGAAMTQRPDLFAAAVPEVGVLDLLRFHRFTIGWAWTSDYGTPEDPEDFARLLSFSPLHNIWPRTAYPATLVVTGDTDDRVVPAHSYKFAAALQAAQASDAPVLLRVETRAGHGAGTPTRVLVDARADVLAFLTAVLDRPERSGPSV